MNTKSRILEINRCQSMIIDGITLDIDARQISDDEWELSVENVYGIRSVWTDLFPTAEAAINAGLKAIESEGVDEFTDAEGFEYLFEG